MNYAAYFLTVHDIVRFAREQGFSRKDAARRPIAGLLLPWRHRGRSDQAHLLFERFVSRAQ